MNRLLDKKLFSSVLAGVFAASLLAACGGGSSHSTALPPSTPDSSTTSTPYNGPLADAVFHISIPGPQSSAFKRRPSYVSSATKSVKFVINTATALTAGQITTYNALAWHLFNTPTPLGTGVCPVDGSHAGNFVCTVTIKIPPGSDNITMSAYDATNGTGNVLSQQIQTFTVTAGGSAGGTNNFSTTLDANANTMTVTGSGFCAIGTVANGGSFGSVGTTPVTFTVSFTDLATKTIVAPGLPIIAIQGNDAAFHSDNGTINGTGGTVGFTINQAAQTYTLTPSGSSVTGASVVVHATPANTNTTTDGLAFTKSLSYTFATGTAPPAHNFLAAVEQLTLSSGQVDLYNVSLGGNTPGSDTFSAFSPATLAVTASTNQAGVNDVDNPQDLRWDTNGDLLIANGGGSAGDNGNIACVPVGSIATGSAQSTTVTTNVDDPVSLAYDSRNGALAAANNPVSSPVQLAEYALTGNYTPSSNNYTASGFGSFGTVIEMPSLTAGTFAISLSTGAEEDTTHAGTAGTNKVVILSPTGVATTITDDTTYTVDKPWGLAWDAANSQLVIANDDAFHKLLSFYTVSPVTFVKSVLTSSKMSVVAASADGHVAVGLVHAPSGNMQVQVYDNTAARNPVGGPIPYNGTTTSCGTTYIYGNGTTIVNALKWLSNTKLLVAVQSNNSGTPTALNGFYVYDITNLTVPAGFDDGAVCTNTFAAAPTNTGFVHVNNKPLGAAFKP